MQHLAISFIFIMSFSLIINRYAICQGKFAPPNTARLYDNIYMDRVETSNADWLEYLQILKKDSTQEVLLAAIPDSTSQIYFGEDSITFKTYLTHPDYKYHPIINISHQQAVAFGKWRSARIQKLINDHPEHYRLKKNKRVKINYRLPTEKEWEYAAQGNLDSEKYPFGLKNIHFKFEKPIKIKKAHERIYKDSISYKLFKKSFRKTKVKKDIIFNVIKSYNGLFNYGEYFPKSVLSTKESANPLGMSNMIGNVLEMISEKGIAKGGSYLDELDKIHIKSRWLYKKPSLILGVRYVCEVEIYKTNE